MIPVGPDPARVVQVRVRPSFGTGYMIGPGLVLTAAHVVLTEADERPVAVTVQVPGQEQVDGAVVWWKWDERVDAALVRTAAADGASPRSGLATRFGRFVTAEPNQAIEAIGFPRQQKFESVRDQEQFAGLLSPETGVVSGHYELTSTTPLPASVPAGQRTPWAGMSGGAVFSAGLLVGVLRGDRRARFGARLTATPAAELLADEAFRRVVAESIGLDPMCEPVELSGFLESPYPNRDLRSVASLLRADTAVVAFHGRETEIERLTAWCAKPDPLAVLIVTGQGGEGKSRLARRLLAEQRARGWTAGLLRSSVANGGLGEDRFAVVARTRGPLLLAVDYAENRPRQVRDLLRRARAARGPVRLLLLARERGEWAHASDEPDAEVRDLLADAPELALTPLTSTTQDWDAAFELAVRDIARVLPAVPGHEEADWPAVAGRVAPPPAETHRRSSSVLGIQMTALTLLLQEVMPVAAERGEPLERTVLRHEEAYWTRTALRCGLRGLDRTMMRCAVAALRLVTVADQDQTVRLLSALGVGDSERGRIAARWLGELYPQQADVYLGLVQPDRLTEFLLVEACAEEPNLLTRIVIVAEHCGHAGQLVEVEAAFGAGSAAMFGQMTALREAVRAARSQAHFGNPVRPLLEQIERTASGPAISDETLAWTVANTRSLPDAGKRQDVRGNPGGGHIITGTLDSVSAALEIAGFRRGAHSMVTDDPRQQGFTHMLHAMTLAQLGRHEEALEVSADAVWCFRSVPGGENEVAMELHFQARQLLALGRDTEAVAPLREAVELCTSSPQDDLPWMLDELIIALRRTGQVAQAVPYARREIELLRPSSPAPTLDNARRYLRALGRYAEILTDNGDPRAGLDHCVQAEEFLAGLPASTADGLTGDRAPLPGVRARILAELGDQTGSAAAWLDSAAAWQRLDATYDGQDPVTRAVGSLNNAAIGHAALGDHTKALDFIRAAVELALGERGESLRRDDPERYESVHATYVGYLVIASRSVDALHEAERLCTRPVSSGTPLPPSLANSLREASLVLAGAGRLAEATRASRIAVSTLQAIDVPEHDLNLSILLATTLADHAANLAETGAGDEGARAGAEAADTWRRVCAVEPRLRINLVTALSNQGECLRLGERYGEAARVFAEATDELRTLVRESPERREMLAHLLGTQAYSQFEAGDYRMAVLARTEEVDIRRELWRTDPSAAAGLARACAGLAVASERVGRYSDALAAADEALRILHGLYGPEPGANWLEVAHLLLISGAALVRTGHPVSAVVPFTKGMGMALRAGDTNFADSCRAGITLAHQMDPVRVAAEWQRVTGFPYPADPPSAPR